MPINKNAYIRYRILDRCFRNKFRRYRINELIEACSDELGYKISRRQIYNDINFMESDSGWNIPLIKKRSGNEVYYRYGDPDFSIEDKPLTDEESQQLKTLIAALGRFRGLPNNEWMEEVISNLEFRFNIGGRKESVIGFEQNPYLKGLEHLSQIIDATANHQPLKIAYHNYKNGGRDITFTIHPYYIKQYNNRWFLFGLDNDKCCIANLALDRIVSLTVAEGLRFTPNKTIDFGHYFDDVIGVTIPKGVEPIDICLRFSESRFLYVTSKPLHNSQRTVDPDKRIISIKVKPNNELEQQILAFGPDVECFRLNGCAKV